MKIISYPFASVLVLLSKTTTGLPQYAQKIPNGYGVPNPGPEGGVWAGVGHENAAGGGARNPFGLDFAANGHEWTVTLCEADSDGDGRTNGEELGDPNCTWMQGEMPDGPALSHPGIMDEPQAPATNNCDDYVSPDDEVTMDIAFSAPTQMDGSQTHYICEQMLMDIPATTVLHKIKHDVLLDNSNVLHHMFVFICPSGSTSTDGDHVGQGHYECSGNESGCRRIGSWAVGPHERCEPPNVGLEIDFSQMMTDQVVVKIEAHYDNTSGEPQQDQSGIRLHMTPTLRPLIGTSTITGMAAVNNDFVIPARDPGFALTSICPSAITENLQEPVYAYAFTPHMHLFGKSLVTEHYRCGEKIGELGRITAYEFDNQQTYTLDPPIKILPGDSFVTTCGYDTSKVDLEVRGGEETTDEMCLNNLSMYPRPGDGATPLAACFSFENGFRNGDQLLAIGDQRLAIGAPDRKFMTTDFESDPSANFGSCCAANNCEELYLAVEGEACGVSDDCMDDLICSGGMCEVSSEANKGYAIGAVCGVSSNCVDDLVCVDGACEFPTAGKLPQPQVVEDTSDAATSAGYTAATMFLAASFLL